MSKFFESNGTRGESIDSPLTYVSYVDDTGELVTKCIELMDNPLAALSFTDFQLSELIAHGISYDALNITPDMRLGHESDFDSLVERFNSNIDSMFVKSE